MAQECPVYIKPGFTGQKAYRLVDVAEGGLIVLMSVNRNIGPEEVSVGKILVEFESMVNILACLYRITLLQAKACM